MLTKLLTKDLATARAFLAAQPVGKAVTCLDLLHEGNHDDRAVALMLALNDAYRQGKPLVSDATWDALYDWCEHKLGDDHWHAVSAPGGNEGGNAGTPDEAPGKTIPVIAGRNPSIRPVSDRYSRHCAQQYKQRRPSLNSHRRSVL